MTTKEMTVKDFIKLVLIAEIGKMRAAGLHYWSFLAIASGIEFLGACFGKEDFHSPGMSKKRFKKGIELLPCGYKTHSDSLYANLRCGFAHVVRPQNGVLLTTKGEKLGNLSKGKNGALILVAEDFYKDFMEACEDMIKKINKQDGSLDKKVSGSYLYITSLGNTGSDGLSSLSPAASGAAPKS